MKSAYTTGKASNYATWFEVAIPGRDSFYFTGEPADLGFSGATVNSVQTIHGYIIPNTISGFATASS